MKRKAQYLFFDIECSNGKNICSFGYCLVDSALHIVEKKDIIINPENRFVLAGQGHRPKIELAYPAEFFYKQNNFRFYYEEIKSLLSRHILIGHSVKSDLLYLDYACQRYHLPPFNVPAYDTQKLYQRLFDRSHIESLESILTQLDIDASSLTFHRSCDDAKATFLVAREMAFRQDMTLTELLDSLPECKVEPPVIKTRPYKARNSRQRPSARPLGE